MEYKKELRVKLSDVGKDERWLQDQIIEDTSILGLGDLVVIPLEKPKHKDGKSDFLMYGPENSVRYEIKIMLGDLDETHVKRIIEYWDEKKRRFPTLEYRAVIVAEDITKRFFDIINLMNKQIPVIAIQLNVFKDENLLFINFVKVLNSPKPIDEKYKELREVTDREYWESFLKSVGLADSMTGNDKTISEPVVTYSKSRIGWGIS